MESEELQDGMKKMQIQLYDLSIKEDECRKRIFSAIESVIQHSQFIHGNETQTFEKRWAKYCNYKYAIGSNSGTDSLEAIIRSYCLDKNLDKNGKFIVPVNTYSATAMAICNAGYTPIFIDCNDNYGMNLENLEYLIEYNENIIGIIPVHLYGIPDNILEINKIANMYNLIVIEDAAQAHGLEIPGKNDRIFSFYPTKNLGAFGDGGMIVTDSKERAIWIEKWRNQGRLTKDTIHHEIIGSNSRLDTLQAAILDVKLDYLDIWNKNRYNNAQLYYEFLSDTDIILPPNKGVFHFYVIRTKMRDKLLKSLREKGIGCSIHYPLPLHLQNAFKYLGYNKGDFPIAEILSNEIISIPMHPYLKEEETKFVCDTIKDILK